MSDWPELKTCGTCQSKVSVESTSCPTCEAPLKPGTAKPREDMTINTSFMPVTLQTLGWLFAIAGVVTAFVVYPDNPITPKMTLESYTVATAVRPAKVMLAWQLAVSGIVAGLLVGSLGCILKVLEQIRDGSHR